MSVTAQTPLNSYTGNGVTTVFAFSFLLLLADDLTVKTTTSGVVSTKVLGTDYTVSGLGVGSGGTVTFTAAPANGAKVVIYRDSDIARATDYQNNGDLLAATVNLDFDRLWLVLQEIFSGSKGAPTALRVPNGETVPELAAAADRALRILSFDSLGNPALIVGVDSGSAAALALDLASSAAATKGSGLVGHNVALPYQAGTIGLAVKEIQSTFRILSGADATGVVDCTASMKALFDYCIPNNVQAVIPGGTYLVSGPITSASYASGSLILLLAGGVTINVNAASTAFSSLLSCETTTINSCAINGGRLALLLNSRCANGIYLRHYGGDGGAVNIGPVTITGAKNNDAASTAENQAILIYGRYTSVNIVHPIVDGVSRTNVAAGACKGISVNDIMGQCTIESPSVARVLCTGATSDADGISIFGYQLNGVYGQRGGTAQVNNGVFTDCQGRSLKFQVSESIVTRPRIYRRNIVSIDTADIDFQVGNGVLIEPFFEYRLNGATSPLHPSFYPVSIQQQCTDRPNRLVWRGGTLRTEVAVARVAYLTIGATALDGTTTIEEMELQALGALSTSIVTRAFLETHAGQVAASAGTTHITLKSNRGNMSGFPLLGYTDFGASVSTKLSYNISANENTGAGAANSRVFLAVSGSSISAVKGFNLSSNINFLDTLNSWTFSFATLPVGCRFTTDIATAVATNPPAWGASGVAHIECLGMTSATTRTVRVTKDDANAVNTVFHTGSGGTTWGTIK